MASKDKATLSVQRARQIIGTSSKVMTDDEIQKMIDDVGFITDIVVNILYGSKIKFVIENLPNSTIIEGTNERSNLH